MKDHSLKDPNCVFQLLKKHYSRYTPEMVYKITGTPADKLVEIYNSTVQRVSRIRQASNCMPWDGRSIR